MNSVVKVLRRAEAKLEKQLGTVERELSGVRSALQALGGSGKTGRKRKGMSPATRKRMAKAARLRWAKQKAEKKSA